MILKLSGDINEEMLDQLIEAYNSLPENEDMNIYLKSRGGEYGFMEAMLDIINCNLGKTFLNAAFEIGSCAFELFFKANCKKYLIGGCVGMYHQSSINIERNEFGKPKDTEDVVREDYIVNFARKTTTELCNNLGMTKHEIERIDNGENVWFTVERMREFLEYQNN